MRQEKVGERQLKYLTYLNAIIVLGYLSLGFGYLYQLSTGMSQQDITLTAAQFIPVLIVGMCSLVLAFTCGEFFGLLRYQFGAQDDTPGLQGLRLIATRSLNIFFMLSLSFYFLRAGFTGAILEKVFFIGLPLFLGGYLLLILRRLNQAHLMAAWYFILKNILICACILGQFVANIILFFPEFIATLFAML